MASPKMKIIHNCNDPSITSELNNFYRQKEKENERSRIKAVEAMILAEQRKRGEFEKNVSREMTRFVPNINLQYLADGRLNFSPTERRNVQRKRDEKAARIEFFLRSQKGESLEFHL